MGTNGQYAGSDYLRYLSPVYYKILKINLTEDCHQNLRVQESEIAEDKGYSDKISVWLREFAEKEQVYRDDMEKYLQFTEMDNLRRFFREGHTYGCCHYRRKIDGEYRWVSMELVKGENYSPENEELYLYVKDIHDEFLHNIDEMDFVTGGINRRGFLRQAESYLERTENPRELALMLFNIKGFKAVNELFGSDGGDELLKMVYLHLKNSFLQPILIARMEGDRFVCLVERKNINYDQLADLCKKDYICRDRTVNVYVRCGIYLVEDRNVSVVAMCDYAKIAKNCIVDEYIKPYAVFDQNMRVSYIVQSEVRGRIVKALENKEFEVYYQPIFQTKTGKLMSAEALVRWNHPDRGLLLPGEFIPALEESGHITRLDYFVMEEVRRFQLRMKRKGLPVIPVSVNLSWMDFYDDSMIQAILEDLDSEEGKDIPARFELTETSYAALQEREDDILGAFRNAGAQIMLDDFGSGYASFSTVGNYDFDLIKLDMGFVQKIGMDEKVKNIIKSIIDMAHQMHMQVVAEGVELQEQMDFLTFHGCDYIQGHYFSRPVPEEQFVQMLSEGYEGKMAVQEEELSLTDLISVELLQKIQDSFSDMTGIAALTTDRHGVPVTQGSNFTEFCMKYTRSSKLGASRCFECDRKGAELALQQGKSCAYACHAGLIDFAAPIMANGEMIGCFIGGQVLEERPDRKKVGEIAGELGLDAELYWDAVQKVHMVERDYVDVTSNFLYVIANVLSEMAYNSYMVDKGNNLLQKKNMELDYLANYDKLTKLSNRHHILKIFEQYRKSGKPYCVIIGDIDNFKSVNDTYGHNCGDLVLASVADIIKNTLEERGVPGRWGGEEFLLLLYGERETAGEILELVRQRVEENVIRYQGHDVRVTMTFGMADGEERSSVEKMISLADQRLYFGKQHGKNRIIMAS